MNPKATWTSVLFGILGTVLITWANEAQTLTSFSQLIEFAFVTKVVITLVGLTGLNTILAHKSFRDPNQRTRAEDSRISDPRDIRSRRPIGDVTPRE